MKRTFLIAIIAGLLAGLYNQINAGLHLGMVSAVKAEVKKLDNKVREKILSDSASNGSTGIIAAVKKGNAGAVITWPFVPGALGYNLYWSNTQSLAKALRSGLRAVQAQSTQVPYISSPYNWSGLTNGTTYYFAITSINADGETPLGSERSFTPDSSTPFPPATLEAKAASGQVTLTWPAVAGAGSYNIYWSGHFDFNENAINKLTGLSTTTYIHQNLTNDTRLFYAVTAIKSGLESTYSAIVSTVVSGGVAPGNLHYLPIGDKTITLTWDLVPGAAGYNVYWSPTPDFTKTTATKITGATRPFTHNGLTNNVWYYYAVSAVTGSGEGPLSDVLDAIAFRLFPPSAPVLAPGLGVIAVSWNAVSSATAYNLYWSNSADLTKRNGNKITVTTNTYTHTGLAAATTYYYAVEATSGTEVSILSPVARAVTATVTPPVSGQWLIETVDSQGDVGSWPAMAVAGDGTVHITYRDVTNAVLKYARKSGGAWSFANIGNILGATAGLVKGVSSISLDGNDRPNVSFHRSDVAFYYTHWTGTAWTTPSAIPSGQTAWAFLGHNSIAVDRKTGVAHVTFDDTEPSHNCPRFSYWNTTLNASQSIESACLNGVSMGERNAVAVDGNSGVHMVYSYDGPSSSILKYVGPSTRNVIDTNDYWTPANNMEEYNVSLALDAQGRPHVAYRDTSAYKYASLIGGNWVISVITTENISSNLAFISLALEANGTPHVAYIGSSYSLKHAYFNGSAWIAETVDASADGEQVAISVEGNGGIHIAYCAYGAGGNRYLKHATKGVAGQTYTLVVSPVAHGTIISNPGGINCGATCSANFSSGTLVSLTGTPDSGYSFSGWSGGVCSGTGNCVVTMNGNKTVSAAFSQGGTPGGTGSAYDGEYTYTDIWYSNGQAMTNVPGLTFTISNGSVTQGPSDITGTVDSSGNFSGTNSELGTIYDITGVFSLTSQFTLSSQPDSSGEYCILYVRKN